ncbi:MAG: hypothetical protein JNK05_11745 [Myxococcales bacterium]|nr:hypothetical protein [Myxococcales bacterium]
MYTSEHAHVVREYLGRPRRIGGRLIRVVGVGNVLDDDGIVRLHVRLADGSDATFAHALLTQTLGVPIRTERSAMVQLLRSPAVVGEGVGHAQCQCLGTLGAFLVGRDRNIHLLSNRHVLALRGENSVCDAVVDANGQRIAHVSFVAPFTGLVDVALAHLEPDQRITVLDQVQAVTAQVGDTAWKVGFASGWSQGRVVSRDFALVIEVESELRVFAHQIAIRGSSDETFSVAGDSGALVRDHAGHALGLLFAGDTGIGQGARLTFVNPIRAVLSTIPLDARVFV